MKNILPILLLALLFTTSCSNIFEKQLDIYDDAIGELDGIDDFNILMNEILDTETRISQAVATTTDEEWEDLKEDYRENYELMLDSLENRRNEYYAKADRLFLEYTFNFVERRIILYRVAADRYCKTEYIEELNAIRETIKRYSRLSFVDNQRSCDPPAKIREEYEATRNLAENCYDLAEKRILEKDE
ncbi:MAG: hypothetical protein J6U89_06420 [Bacteroidaceae bacterium]|nr:hypothetical protein [Bacteroidaceae bacterium]